MAVDSTPPDQPDPAVGHPEPPTAPVPAQHPEPTTDPTPAQYPARPVFRGLSPRASFWLTFVLFFGITALWALSSPPMSSVDEAQHAIKAAAVVRGEFLGDQSGQRLGSGVVLVPELFRESTFLPLCYATDPEQNATCQPVLGTRLAVTTTAVTSAVRYNPLYYALAGLPSLVSNSMLTFYLMRLVSALLAAWLLALVVRTLTEVGRSFWPLAGLLVAVVPMVFYLAGSINPQSVEIPAAVLVWVTLLALLRTPVDALLTRRLVRLTIGVVLLANVRGLGPPLLAGMVVAVVAGSRWRPMIALLAHRRTWLAGFLGLAAVATALVWTQRAGTLTLTRGQGFPGYIGETIVRKSLETTSAYLEQTIGVFGWLNVPMPVWTYFVAVGLLLVVIVLGFALARWREQLAMLGVAVVVLGLPIYAEYQESRFIGHFWQGRYVLPLAVGVPLLAGFAMHNAERTVPYWIGRRLLLTLGVGVALLQAHAVGVNLRRYVNGTAELAGWVRINPGSWRPPLLHPYALVGASLALWLVLAVVLVRAANGGHPNTTGKRMKTAGSTGIRSRRS